MPICVPTTSRRVPTAPQISAKAVLTIPLKLSSMLFAFTGLGAPRRLRAFAGQHRRGLEDGNKKKGKGGELIPDPAAVEDLQDEGLLSEE